MKGLKYLIELKDKVSGTADKIARKVKPLSPALDKLKSKMNGVNRAGSNTTGLRRFSTGLAGMAKNLMRVTALSSVLSLAGLAAVGSQATSTALDISNASRVINFATAGKGAENIQFLDKTIKDLNLPLKETYASFSQVAGAFKDTKLQGAGMRNIFEGVATASAAMNLGPEKSNRVFLALSQIMSKGKLSAEELTQQLGEALPGSLGIAARSMGKSKAEFYKLMEQGKIMSEDFLPKFAEELKKTFGEEALRAAKTPAAAFQMWRNSVDRVKSAIGENLLPILVKLARHFAPLMEKAAPMVAVVFENIFQGINTLYAIARPLLEALNSVFQQIREPLFTFINVLYQVGNVLRSVIFEGLASFINAIDFGYILGGLFAALIPLLLAIKKGFEAARPLLNILGLIAGVIVNILGKIALKVIEALAYGFTKMANGVTWVYQKITDLLSVVGLLDKKKVNVDVGVNKPTDLFAGLRKSDQGNGFGAFGAGTFEGDGLDLSGGGSGAGDAAGKAIDNVARGGSKPTNINVSLGSLISGGFTVQTTNMKEGAEKVEEIVMNALLKVLNGANQVANG